MRESVEIPDEPPPAYEAIASPTSSAAAGQSTTAPVTAAVPTGSSNVHSSSSGGAGSGSVHAIDSHLTGTSSTNPFLSLAGSRIGSTSSNQSDPFAEHPSSVSAASPVSPTPDLPPRRYNAAVSPAAAPVSPPLTAGSATQLGRVSSTSSSMHSANAGANGRVSADATSPGRLDASPQHHRPPSVASVTSSPTSGPAPAGPPAGAAYHPPPGRPPSSASPASSSTSPSAQNHFRPTTVPTPGQPLLRNGKLLVYPKNWTGCHKCGDTGYKQGDPTQPCRKCWDKYGKTFSGALSYSVGLNDPTSKLQKPLPVRAPPPGGHYGAPTFYGPPGGGAWPQGPSHGYVPGGYPGAVGASGPSRPYHQPYHQPHYGPPGGQWPPPPRPPPPQPSVNRSDVETEASKMPDAPPNYNDASNVGEHERLPAQYTAPAAPPPGVGPPMHSPPPHPPHSGPPGPVYGGGYGPPHAPMVRPSFQQFGRPPPGALVVMPGDPRIGGRLCYECGGRGITESFWFGDETCFRCRGSGRVF